MRKKKKKANYTPTRLWHMLICPRAHKIRAFLGKNGQYVLPRSHSIRAFWPKAHIMRVSQGTLEYVCPNFVGMTWITENLSLCFNAGPT